MFLQGECGGALGWSHIHYSQTAIYWLVTLVNIQAFSANHFLCTSVYHILFLFNMFSYSFNLVRISFLNLIFIPYLLDFYFLIVILFTLSSGFDTVKYCLLMLVVLGITFFFLMYWFFQIFKCIYIYIYIYIYIISL